ncbi:MAG: DUF1810 domain-containing protein [Chlorobium sp.]|nr:DUF1810 domain-containing protein [Chlorobium sp.]MCW8816074.1 DUF1810 domain-containing protein [Chlorobium sp.]
MEDEYNLQRFLDAQENCFERVLGELRLGKKSSHWMWYIFPQLYGLGRSSRSKKYAIHSTAEALAYLQHPDLGPRLKECAEAVNVHKDLTVEQIFRYPDYRKFHSCMTLFGKISKKNSPFHRALETFFAGEPDRRTLSLTPQSDFPHTPSTTDLQDRRKTLR